MIGSMRSVAGQPGRSSVRRSLRRLATVVAALAIGSVAAGCSGVRGELGTSDAPCYVALPTATAAVGQEGHLAGVRLMKVSSLPYPRIVTALHDAGVDSGRVCLVAFTGNFTSTSVSHPSGRASGHLAVVMLRYPSGRLVATVLLKKLPVRFGHSHVG